jgi:membrane fusion protein (multidrug efflux system)
LFLLAVTGCEKEQPKPPVPVHEVEVVTVKSKTVPASFIFVAQTVSSHQVEVMARVSGFLEKITYKEGALVHVGDVLFQIDAKPFEAQVQAAAAQVEARSSQLWTAKANYDRIRPLAEQKAASMSDLDNATGAVKAAEAGLHGAEAELEQARLNLGYTTIKSPVTGVTGKALIQEGAYVSASSSSAKLTYVAMLDPIWVEFSVSQNQMASVREQGKKGLLSMPADKKFPVELELADGDRYAQTGAVNFADPSFSKDTGTFMMRAEVANPDGVLQPGMFVKALLGGMTRPNVIVVPQKAVVQTANGHVIYVVTDKGVSELRPVIVGEWVGQDWIINQGLKDSEQVVVAGFQKLGAGGMPVKVVSPGQSGQATAPNSTQKQ